MLRRTFIPKKNQMPVDFLDEKLKQHTDLLHSALS
jgi:hypothetical protein